MLASPLRQIGLFATFSGRFAPSVKTGLIFQT
jgi:hypothetical protein